MTVRPIVIVACVALACRSTTDDSRGGRRGDGIRDSNQGEGWHTCPDGPWRTVEVGYELACGIHEDGCIECWGSEGWEGWPDSIYDEPDIDAVALTMRAGQGDSTHASRSPFACAVDSGGTWVCWGDPGGSTEWDEPSLVAAAVDVAVGDRFLAMLDGLGHLSLRGWDYQLAVEVEGVDGPLVAGSTHACAAAGIDLVCWSYWDEDQIVVVGPMDSWVQYTSDDSSLVGVRADGAVVEVDFYGVGERIVAPAGSAWVSVRGSSYAYFVSDAGGYVYSLAHADAGPRLPEPMATFDLSGYRYEICGVTFDGLMRCTRDYDEVYPPPGEHIVR